ncbi:hypothetical protein [Parahaliea mediterranea]|uniref:hypothetical protein n=1 Tax=Parahaliea mediterranea TaxID=651086 RepID=UPI000E2E61F5|nr:hypothetical protein [Parahaliea mediterranea]
MKHLLTLLTLGALLAGASSAALSDDRHRGDRHHGDRERWHHEYRDHHRAKHYRKHHAPPHWKKHYRGSHWHRHPDWRRHDSGHYLGGFFGLPGINISLRHYHEGRACYDRHDRRRHH